MSDQETRDKRRCKRERKNAAPRTPGTSGRQLRRELHAEETQYDAHMEDDLFNDPNEPYEELNFQGNT